VYQFWGIPPTKEIVRHEASVLLCLYSKLAVYSDLLELPTFFPVHTSTLVRTDSPPNMHTEIEHRVLVSPLFRSRR